MFYSRQHLLMCWFCAFRKLAGAVIEPRPIDHALLDTGLSQSYRLQRRNWGCLNELLWLPAKPVSGHKTVPLVLTGDIQTNQAPTIQGRLTGHPTSPAWQAAHTQPDSRRCKSDENSAWQRPRREWACD